MTAPSQVPSTAQGELPVLELVWNVPRADIAALHGADLPPPKAPRLRLLREDEPPPEELSPIEPVSPDPPSTENAPADAPDIAPTGPPHAADCRLPTPSPPAPQSTSPPRWWHPLVIYLFRPNGPLSWAILTPERE